LKNQQINSTFKMDYLYESIQNPAQSWTELQNVLQAQSRLFYIVVGAVSLATYIFIIRSLRYRRAAYHDALFKTCPSYPQEMSVPVAQEIYSSLFDAEFPFFFMKGVQLGLFRTYAIPTISVLLDKTQLLGNPDTVARRYAETEVLFLEFAKRQWGSRPWLEAMARTRAIHAGYRKSGVIREADMVFTLCATATSGVDMVEQWEWRSLTDTELCAIGALYRGIGDGLGIDYEDFLDLPDPKTSPNPSGLDFYRAMRKWQSEYENWAMKYAPQNHDLAKVAIELLLLAAPGKTLKRWGATLLTVLMDVPLRTAVGYPAPPRALVNTASMILNIRGFVLRNFVPPRPEFLRITRTIDIPQPGSPNARPMCAFAGAGAAAAAGKTCPFTSNSNANGAFTKSGSVTPPEPPISLEKADGGVAAVEEVPFKTVLTEYIAAPYFVAPSFWNRWGPSAWYWWALGLPIPGDKAGNGCTFQSGGYSIPQVGPRVGKGVASQKREEDAVFEMMRKRGWDTCPVNVVA
jgi:hypothetical protein